MQRAMEFADGSKITSLPIHQRQIEIAREYLNICIEYAPQNFGTVRSHLNKFLFCLFQHAQKNMSAAEQEKDTTATTATAWPEEVCQGVLVKRDELNGLYPAKDNEKLKIRETRMQTIQDYLEWLNQLSSLIAPHIFDSSAKQAEWYWRHRGEQKSSKIRF